MKLHEILTETRIINQDDPFGGGVRGYVESFHKGVPEIDRWLDRKLTGFLTAHYRGPALDDITAMYDGSGPPSLTPDDNQSWIHDAIRAGEPIYYFVTSNHGGHQPDPNLDAQVRRILDWFEHLMQNDPPVFSRLDRITWDQAVASEQRWHEQLARQSHRNQSRAVMPGMKEVLKTSAGTWYRLTSAEALDQEGKLMGHCVGSYARQVAGGETEIYSLRDDDNQPHVTIEVKKMRGSSGGTVQQIKGKQNKVFVGKYLPAVRAFLTHTTLPVSVQAMQDLKGTDLILTVEGKVGQIGDWEIWLKQKRPDLPRHLWAGMFDGHLQARRDGAAVVSMPVSLHYFRPQSASPESLQEPTLHMCSGVQFTDITLLSPVADDDLVALLNELTRLIDEKSQGVVRIEFSSKIITDLIKTYSTNYRNGRFETKAQRDLAREKLERVHKARQARKADRS